jgi:hypothetical protein
MSESQTKLTRRHKLLLASLATVTLSLGAAGVVSAAQSPTAQNPTAPTSAPAPSSTSAPTSTTKPAAAEPAGEEPAGTEVDGVDCQNGIDPATGAQCDGGPSANPQDGADEATEPAGEAPDPAGEVAGQ